MGVAYRVAPYIYTTTESKDGVTEITGSLAIYQQPCDSYIVEGSLWTVRDCVAGCSRNYNTYWSDHCFCLFCQQGVITPTLHSISLTDNHAHILTGDKVTGPYVYADRNSPLPPCIIYCHTMYEDSNQLASRERLFPRWSFPLLCCGITNLFRDKSSGTACACDC